MLNYTKEGVSLYLFHENRYAAKENKKAVKIVVYFRGERKYFPTGVSLTDEDWKQLRTCKKKEIVEHKQGLEQTFYKFKAIIDNLLEKNQFSFENINRKLGHVESLLLEKCFMKKIETLENNNQFNSAQNYLQALKTFRTFDLRDLDLKQITVEWLKRYEHYMLDSKRSYTTIGMYLRNLRTVMNEAIYAGMLDHSYYPFGRGKYEIPSGDARKLALPMSIIEQIYRYESPTDPSISKYRDLWMFSYLCNGANFNDILRLKFKDINGDEISFLRGKLSIHQKRKRVLSLIFPMKCETSSNG